MCHNNEQAIKMQSEVISERVGFGRTPVLSPPDIRVCVPKEFVNCVSTQIRSVLINQADRFVWRRTFETVNGVRKSDVCQHVI